jgi:hypothetical protein
MSQVMHSKYSSSTMAICKDIYWVRQQLVQLVNVLGIHSHADNVYHGCLTSGDDGRVLAQAGDTFRYGPGWYTGYQLLNRDYMWPTVEHWSSSTERYGERCYSRRWFVRLPFTGRIQALRYASLDRAGVLYDGVFLNQYGLARRYARMSLANSTLMYWESRLWVINTRVASASFIVLWTHGEYRRQSKVQQSIFGASANECAKALPKIGASPEHTQAGFVCIGW